MMLRFLLVLLLLVTSSAYAQTSPPVLATVPGIANPAVTQSNIHQTICVSGWSAKQRPPTSYTDPIKLRLLRASGYPDQNPAHYELDHNWSIENGGSPTSLNNLWLEYYLMPCGAHVKDKLENKLHQLVCKGTITLAQDQAAFGNWGASYNKYIGPLSCSGTNP